MIFLTLSVLLAAPDWKPINSVEGISEYALDNGMHLLTFPDASKATVTVNITYFVGSRNEDYGETGMAHLLEHMLFKGTPTTKGVPQALSEHGARANGTTWLDRTNYYETVQATDQNTEWALRFEADRMINSFVAKKDLDSEMTVVRNEFESGENNPRGVLMQRAIATAFLWHNYGKSTIGARSDIERVPIHRLQGFYKKYYQPDNAVLVVAGKFDEAKVKTWVKDSFGKIPKPSRVLTPTYTSEPTQDGERSVTLRRVGDVQAAMTVYHVPPASHTDAAAVDVLASVLGATPSGRLYKQLVETKKATAVFDFNFQTKEPGMLLFGAEVRKEQSLDAARDGLIKIVEESAQRAPSDKEVERAKLEIAKSFELTMNDSQRLAIELSEWAGMGDWRLFFLHRDRVALVNASDVKRVAAAYLKASNRTSAVFVPTDKPERAEIPEAPELKALVAGYQGRALLSEGESFDTSPLAIDKRTVRGVLPSGIKTAFLQKQTRADMVQLSLALHFGSDKALMGKDIVGAITADMLMRGTKKHDREAIDEAFDRLKARVQVDGDAVALHVSLEVDKKNLAQALALVREVLREPSFDAKELELLRQAQLAQFEESKSQPQSIGATAYEQHIHPWPVGHPLHMMGADAAIAALKAVKLADIKAFYVDFYGAQAGELAVVGAYEPAVIDAFTKASFAGWKAKQKFTRIAQPYQAIAAKTITLATPDKANAFFMAGLPLEISDAEPEYAALALGNFMLGGGFLNSRLALIRTRDGLSYGVGSVVLPNFLDNSATYTAYAIYAPANRAALEKVFDAELKKVLDEGFTDDEIRQAKTGWMQARQVQRGTDAQLCAKLVQQSFNGRSFAFDAELESRVQALDNKTIQAVLKKHIAPEKITKVFVGDFK